MLQCSVLTLSANTGPHKVTCVLLDCADSKIRSLPSIRSFLQNACCVSERPHSIHFIKGVYFGVGSKDSLNEIRMFGVTSNPKIALSEDILCIPRRVSTDCPGVRLRCLLTLPRLDY
jgi:hypothetical protein